MNKKPILMLFIDWYYPAFKAGGPVIAAVNFVDNMKAFYELYIYTGDRDLADAVPFNNIKTDIWISIEKNVNIFYASPRMLSYKVIKKEVSSIRPEYIYLHSLYSFSFSIIPMLIKRFGKIHSSLILAPRGNLKDSALAHKSRKKKIFLQLFRMINLHKDIIFHATDQTEAKDIQHHLGVVNTIEIVPDFAAKQTSFISPPYKENGKLKIVFVGRIHPIKNLDFLLRCLEKISGDVLLTIIGNAEDSEYWSSCQQIIKELPPNIHVDMRYQLEHTAIKDVLLSHHIFSLPTKGENFGHAIYEALSYGKPVLISDQTPWRGLTSNKAGWDLSLSDPNNFKKIIEDVLAWDNDCMITWSKGAWEFCNIYLENSDDLTKYRNLFSNN